MLAKVPILLLLGVCALQSALASERPHVPKAMPTSAGGRAACSYTLDAPLVYDEVFPYEGVFAADFDGDGKLDAGVTAEGSFRIRYGVGGGKLSAPQALAMDVIAIGDLAGDALPDLILAGNRIVPNLGRREFAAVSVETEAGTPLIADFTGDRLQDLLLLSPAGDRVTLYERSGSALTRRAPESLAKPVRSIAAGDVDGDGVQDLVGLRTDGLTIDVLRGNPGGFTTRATLTLSGAARDVAAVDLDGNGRAEILAAIQERPQAVEDAGFRQGVEVFYDGGANGFSESPLNGEVRDLQVHDFSGDGEPDVLLGFAAGWARPMIFVNDRGALRPPERVLFASGRVPLTAGDFNADGTADMVLPTASGFAIVPTREGGGVYVAPMLDAALRGFSHTPVDLNADGLSDFVYQDFDGGVSIASNDGAGGFSIESLPVQFERSSFSVIPSVSEGEILTIDNYAAGRPVSVYRRGASGDWEKTRTVVADAVQALTTDFDGDGITEIVVVGDAGSPFPYADPFTRLKVFSGRTGELILDEDYGRNYIQAVAGDLDGDAIPDLVVAVNGTGYVANEVVRDGSVQVFRGRRGEDLSEPVSVATTLLPRNPHLGDFNGDGRTDIAYITERKIVVQYATAQGYTEPRMAAEHSDYGGDLTSGDLNGDGATDLLYNELDQFTILFGSRNGLIRGATHWGQLGTPAQLTPNAPASVVVSSGHLMAIPGTCAPVLRRRGVRP